MWYVIQVRVGTEENICGQCEKKISGDILQSCFIPYYEAKKKSAGKWKTEQKILFPGYVFLITEQIEPLFFALKKVEGLTKLLATGDEIVPLSQREEVMLKKLGGDDHIVEMSEGIIEGSQIIIESGPLEGQEAYITKIDRHKRKAWLEIPMFGGVQKIEVGLEIKMKIV